MPSTPRRLAGRKAAQPALPDAQPSAQTVAQDAKEKRTWRLQLGIAIIAALSGLLGAASGGVVTFYTTQQQIKAQAAQANDAASKQKRQEAYTAIAGACEDVNTFWQSVPPIGSSAEKLSESGVTSVIKAGGTVGEQKVPVLLYAQSSTVDAYDQLNDDVLVFASATLIFSTRKSPTIEQQVALSQRYSAVTKDCKLFLNAVRSEFATER